MLFSSMVFVGLFLPCVILGYYALFWSRPLQNIFLFAVSVFFYAWGEPKFVLVMLASILFNWLMGLVVSTSKKHGKIKVAKLFVGLTVVCNLSLLFVFKYLNFAIDSIQRIIPLGLTIPKIALPIGISFFTFQAMSYVIDVYRGRGGVQLNPLNVGLYIAFFPQLIAGPIVRYETVAEDIRNRKTTSDDFFDGFGRFIMGFCKKVLLANNFAFVADQAFALNASTNGISVAMAWLGAISYTLQIFFDFSGYSDMAIGLGRMFGFHFLENFDYPYISTSITEFWRRWHISLETWFRDYVYIPLGGSRVSKNRLVMNLFVVWFLTGVWHGANWTFIVWGLMYFALLTAEKLTKFTERMPKATRWIYTMLFVLIGWVLFRADSLGEAGIYVVRMFGITASGVLDPQVLQMGKECAFYLILGCMFSTPIVPSMKKKMPESVLIDFGYVLLMFGLFVVAIASLISNGYNPFIYFNF